MSVVVTNASPVALAPSGAVTLTDTTTGTTLGSAQLDGTGSATFSTAAFNQGSHDLSVQYGGDRDNQPSNGGATLDVSAATSTTTIAADVAQAVFGQTVTFTAHVDAAVNPTGTVTFTDAGQPIGAVPVDADGDACSPRRAGGRFAHGERLIRRRRARPHRAATPTTPA